MSNGPVVALCLPIYDHMENQTWKCVNALRKPGRSMPGATHVFDTQGMLIDDARNMMTDAALAVPEITHLLWIDADMTFDPDALERLLKHDLPIVGGLCFSRRPPYHPILCRKHPEWMGRQAAPFGFVYRYPQDALVDVDATGGAFLLVKREVFEKIGTCNKDWWSKCDGLSEDFAFCKRAKEAGFNIAVDTGLKIGHIGKIVIDEAVANKLRPFQWEAWNPESSLEDITTGAPKASVVIPTYNQNPEFLKAAVLSAAYQTVPVEVIVVDDGSTTPVPTEGWPENVCVLRQENKGISEALNTGIRAMTTPWFCWLSSDDMLDPRKVATQLVVCEQAMVKASFHRYQAIESESEFARHSVNPNWRDQKEQMQMLLKVCAINGSTVMIHKSVFDDVGMFAPSLKYGQDYEMWLRIGAKHFWFGIDEILCTRREYQNLTASIAADDAKKTARDAEDDAIRAKYASWA